MSEPKISVLIPVWNGADHIEACLQALEHQTLPRELFEVIVVDNGSTDHTVKVVSRYRFVRLLTEPHPGSYRARNTGLADVRGTYVALTDADCIPRSDWLEKALASAVQHPEAGIIVGKVELFRASPSDSETCAAYERLFSLNQEDYSKQGACATANWVSPAAVLNALGGFNGELKSSGDFELAARIHKAGYSLVYCPDVVVSHPTRGRVRDMLAKRARVVGGHWTLRKGQVSNARFAYRIIRSGARALTVVLRTGPDDVWLKLRLVGLIVLIVFSNLCEHARLVMAGEPRRA